jgi:O-methyltransferase
VWRGGTAAVLAKAAGEHTTVFLCDTFQGVVKAGELDAIYKGGEHSDTSEDIVISLFDKLNINNYQIIKGIFPDQHAEKLTDKQFKLCHIDVDVYQSAKDIFNWVWPRLVAGGLVVFDDYGFAACEGITTLVNELSDSVENSIFVYNINGHGIMIKTK